MYTFGYSHLCNYYRADLKLKLVMAGGKAIFDCMWVKVDEKAKPEDKEKGKRRRLNAKL